ncbi:MAG: CYTH domain-containing protein [Calditrichaeota bacterium]|nr:MAG: CYTH domain-containing protein [Calditrichota bacterium]
MKSQIEIERKFKVKELPGDLEKFKNQKIEQGYLVVGQDGDEVRLRRKGEKLLMTVKGAGSLERKETEIQLTADQFAALWPLTEGRRVVKRRYEIPVGSTLIELDIYDGPLNPLVTTEVEFTSREASAAFTPPAWIGEEITSDKRYKNRNLALTGIPK